MAKAGRGGAYSRDKELEIIRRLETIPVAGVAHLYDVTTATVYAIRNRVDRRIYTALSADGMSTGQIAQILELRRETVQAAIVRQQKKNDLTPKREPTSLTR